MLAALGPAMLAVSLLDPRGLLVSDLELPTDVCEGCQTHNLFCEQGTGKMHGFTCPGHFAEYSVSDYQNVVKMPKDMDMVRAAPIFCAGVTG